MSGIDLHAAFSFPSGHAATIFSLCVGIMLFSAAPARKLSCFFIALLVAYSRVYLSQHFLIDIYFGSLLGVLVITSYSIHYTKLYEYRPTVCASIRIQIPTGTSSIATITS